jgi:hypothetical protein
MIASLYRTSTRVGFQGFASNPLISDWLRHALMAREFIDSRFRLLLTQESHDLGTDLVSAAFAHEGGSKRDED